MTEILSTTNTPLARSAAKSTAKYVKTLPVEPKSVIWNPSPDELRRYAAAMPNARLVYDAEAGHLLAWKNPAAFREIVREFLHENDER